MRRRAQFSPFCCYDAFGAIRLLRIVAEQEDDILRMIVWDTTKPWLYMAEIGEGQVCEFGAKTARYVRSPSDPIREAAQFKRTAIDRGATPEAIRLLRLLAPIDRNEENIMAEKLKAKATGDKAGLKEAAKAAPVVKKVQDKKEAEAKAAAEAPVKKRGGNLEALKKAREARAVGNRKYKPLVTKKDEAYTKLRDDSWTKYMVTRVIGAKSTDEAKAAHEATGEYAGKGIDFAWAVKKGFIEFV